MSRPPFTWSVNGLARPISPEKGIAGPFVLLDVEGRYSGLLLSVTDSAV